MKKITLSAILVWTHAVALAANIVFSGATGNLCPNISYTYTAQAVNAFGSQKGCFIWSFFADGQLLWSYEVVVNVPVAIPVIVLPVLYHLPGIQ